MIWIKCVDEKSLNACVECHLAPSLNESGLKPMPNMPINLNLALIVHRLLTDPEGWEVRDLMHTLSISDRTYRKYRKLLKDHLAPRFEHEHGVTLEEVCQKGAQVLRLSPGLNALAEGASSASILLMNWVSHAGLESFDISGVEMQRLIWIEPGVRVAEPKSELIHAVLRAMIAQRVLTLRLGNERHVEVCPLSLLFWSTHTDLVYTLQESASQECIKMQQVIHADERLGVFFVYPDELEYSVEQFIAERAPQ